MKILASSPEKYRLGRALRPFSYSVALIVCGLGVALAWAHDQGDIARSIVVVLTGVLLQAAVNLFNDHADLDYWQPRKDDTARRVVTMIQLNTRIAITFTLLGMALGIWLVTQVGWELFALGLFGILGGYAYTGKPFEYKNHGMGVPAVFVFTGVLMVAGAYYAVAREWHLQVVLLAVPVSLLSSALLLANELRDFNDDKLAGIGTLTVKLGCTPARTIYLCCLLSVIPLSFMFHWMDILPGWYWTLPSLLVLVQPYRKVISMEQLQELPPMTGRFFMVFGLGFIAAVF
ncbi:UbiA family prenyltransferase [Endozoicomonadaceae bacterium StTr2]